MAKVVLGIGTSHGPLVNLDGSLWEPYTSQVDFKRKNLYDVEGRLYATYADFAAKNGEPYREFATPEHMQKQAETVQSALDRLALELAKAEPDVVVIVGDDQQELFNLSNNPAISIFYGRQIINHVAKSADPIWQLINKGYGMDERHVFEGVPALAEELIVRLIEQGFDIAAAREPGENDEAGFGHAFGFVIRRLMGEKKVPVLPVLLNTYYPPNQPTPARCYDLGQALTKALEESPADLRVAIVGSGGLSHHITNEALDREVIDAMSEGAGDRLRQLPVKLLQGGSSQIRCWLTTAGACQHLKVAWHEYVPVYRTAPGTGIGLGFACWS